MDVSIIIPTYNVAPYILECLESVASQTYQGVIECIVVDDCGTDESIPLAQEFIDSYNGNIKFRICHREKNGGLSAARNSGLFEAKGEFVYFLDSDDYVTPDCIESLVKVAKLFPNVEIVQGGIVNTKGAIIYDAMSFKTPQLMVDRKAIYSKLVFGELPVSSWNKLIRRDFLKENSIDFYEGVIHEDVDFLYKLAAHVTSFALCPVITYCYRIQREGSILSTTNDDRSTQSRILVYNACLDKKMKMPFRKLLTRSIFLRLIFVLQTAHVSHNLRYSFNTLCWRTVHEASGMDGFWMGLYLRAPKFLKNRFYNLYSKKMKSL